MFLSSKSDIINAEECRRSDKVDHYEVFHDILVNLFQEIMDIEGKALITSEFKDISVNDMHIMEQSEKKTLKICLLLQSFYLLRWAL